MRDYLPRDQGELLAWASTFASESPRSTRTQAIAYTKNKARAAMVDLLRPLVQQIRANPAVSDTLKINIGIRRRGRASSAGGEPPALTGRPKLHISSVIPLRHVLGYTRVEGPGKAKPAGAIGLQLFLHVGDTAPADPADAKFLRFLSRAPYAVDFKPEHVGKTAHYFARWQTATGETGPWSRGADECCGMKSGSRVEGRQVMATDKDSLTTQNGAAPVLELQHSLLLV